MVYLISKIVVFLVNPYHLLVLAGGVLIFPRAWRWLRLMASAYMVFIASLFFVPWGAWLMGPLERWEVGSDLAPGEGSVGTIVLGGAVNGKVSRARGELELSQAGDRVLGLVEALNSTSGPVIYTGDFETQFAPETIARLVDDQAFARLRIEPDALTTAEHPWRIAQAGIELEPNATYDLVTSAFHMPRAAAVFRQAGIKVNPKPVDYYAPGRGYIGWHPRLHYQLHMLNLAIKEYIGLVGYRIRGVI